MNRFPPVRPVSAAALLAAASLLSGCSTFHKVFSDDDAEYRSGAAQRRPLDVPPDLTQLQRDGRYQPQSGIVSASNYQAPNLGGTPAEPSTAGTAAGVAPAVVGDVHLERQGDTRWLVTSLTPEQLWPQLRAFWEANGFTLTEDNPEAGVMQTDWAEDRSKLPKDFLRRALGTVLDSVYSTGQLDLYRTRIERTPQGTEIYLTHRGMEEVLTGVAKDNPMWQARPADPQLEAAMLTKLMVKLGAKEPEAQAAVAATAPATTAPAVAGTPTTPAATGTPRARLLAGQPAAALQLDEPFDRAWRRVGLSLDRSGFTVEDRDRANGLYYVRYADPKMAGQEEPNFLQKLFGTRDTVVPARYRIQVQRGDTPQTTVSVLDTQGKPDNGDIAKRIVSLLVDDLK